MVLSTERLGIIPLDLKQFKLLLDGTERMELALRLKSSNNQLNDHTPQAMKGLYQQAVKQKENHLWYTNWQIILILIGSACFMGCPDENGEVEHGYLGRIIK